MQQDKHSVQNYPEDEQTDSTLVKAFNNINKTNHVWDLAVVVVLV